jgi:hypothetical protein
MRFGFGFQTKNKNKASRAPRDELFSSPVDSSGGTKTSNLDAGDRLAVGAITDSRCSGRRQLGGFDLRNDSTPRSCWFIYGTYHEHASLWLRSIRLAI